MSIIHWNPNTFIRIEMGLKPQILKEDLNVVAFCPQNAAFSTYTQLVVEQVFVPVQGERHEGIKVNVKMVNNISFVDDTAFISKSEQDLQNILYKVIWRGR